MVIAPDLGFPTPLVFKVTDPNDCALLNISKVKSPATPPPLIVIVLWSIETGLSTLILCTVSAPPTLIM